MPLYPHQPVNGAQMAMQGMQQAAQSYAAMGQKREQITKQNTGVMDYALPVGMLGYMGSKTATGGKIVDAIGTGIKGAWEGLTGAGAAVTPAAEATTAATMGGDVASLAAAESAAGIGAAATEGATVATMGGEVASLAAAESAAGLGATAGVAAEGAAAGSALGPIGMGIGALGAIALGSMFA